MTKKIKIGADGNMKPQISIPRRDVSIEEVYQEFDNAINSVEELAWAWDNTRLAPYCEKAIKTYRQFIKGEAGTPDVKHHFATLTTLGLEVVMTEQQQWAVYALAGIAHAAAHLGHLAVATNFRGKPHEAYAAYQRAYALFGLEEAKRFAEKVTAANEIKNRRRQVRQAEAPEYKNGKRQAA